MRQIRFGSTVFDLVSMPNIHVDRMQATILKGANTVESIANAANNAESVAILEDGGISRSDIFSALTPDVTDTEALQKELLDICPSKKSLINQAFKSKRR